MNETLPCPVSVSLSSRLRWRELCGMREARKNHGLVVVNNRIYAVGGQGPLGNTADNKHYSGDE